MYFLLTSKFIMVSQIFFPPILVAIKIADLSKTEVRKPVDKNILAEKGAVPNRARTKPGHGKSAGPMQDMPRQDWEITEKGYGHESLKWHGQGRVLHELGQGV